MTYDQLLRKAQQGDPKALDELCRREWRPIYALVYHAVQNRAEAEDLTQEVFLRALRALDRYCDSGVPFRSFLSTVARNLLRDRWRYRSPSLVDLDHGVGIASGEVGPEDLVLADAERDQLQQALTFVADDYQTVIRLRLLEGRPTAEVATLMGRNAGAIRVLLHRAIGSLRTRLDEDCYR